MRVAILTVSDRSSRGEREDRSGPALAQAVEELGATLAATRTVPDEQEQIETVLREWADGGEVDVILTTGGTGLTARDVTPEATLSCIDRRVPGMAEAMRAASFRVTPHALLSRAEVGTRRCCLIINLPGSPRGAVECLQVVAPALPHAVELLHGTATE